VRVIAAFAALAVACNQDILVGADPVDGGVVKDAAAESDGGLAPLVVPWSTGFEDGFGDWSEPSGGGFCYEMGTGAKFAIVTSPVHSGAHAAAFTIDTAAAAPSQTRCVREGVLPSVAYYGAWYYVPAPTTSFGWNLFHFQGASSPTADVEDLWDVSMAPGSDGSFTLSVYDFIRARTLMTTPTVPIDTWFHLEARLKPSATTAGRFTVYLDGAAILDLTGLETDGTRWGQWYVGNYATALLPAPTTVYVDDVTIATTGP